MPSSMIVREAMPASKPPARVGIVIFASVFGMSFGGWISGVISSRLLWRGVTSTASPEHSGSCMVALLLLGPCAFRESRSGFRDLEAPARGICHSIN